MLNILKKQKNTFFKDVSSINTDDTKVNKQKNEIKNKLDYKSSLNAQDINTIYNSNISSKFHKDEYKNIIYYPSSSKEWFNSVYSYNKSYIKPLITTDVILNSLFKNYFNMLKNKIKILFKRRRSNKIRYSANKIFISRAEIKHTNTKLLIILYTYNKQKSLIEQYMRNIVELTIVEKYFDFEKKRVEYKLKHLNRLTYLLKKRFFFFSKWNIAFFKKSNNLLEYLISDIKKRYLKSHKISIYNIRLLKKFSRLEQMFFNNVKLISFNKSKFSNLFLNLKELGLISFIQKIYDKNVEIKIVELKSIHLNSDVFSSAVALKLRDRKNKAVRILRKAILQMVKIPDLHSLLTFDDRIESINKNNILNVIKQQVVSGVRFETSGRLTRRLTALRAVFKYRYMGSLKNIRSSYNNKSSTLLRGYVKSNSQYTIINSKTRNGAFGLKGWISSH